MIKNKEDISSSTSKNKWGIIPRTPVKNIFKDRLDLKNALDQIENADSTEVERKEIWRQLKNGELSLGHVSSLVDIENKSQIVFENRNPNLWLFSRSMTKMLYK